MDSLKKALDTFTLDQMPVPVVALSIDVKDHAVESPIHRHRKGQLVVALQGAVMCRTEKGIWMVPPRCGMWIPGGIAHSNGITSNGRMCFLFVDADISGLPEECSTLSLSTMLIEMILHFAQLVKTEYDSVSYEYQLAMVMVEELRRMKIEKLHVNFMGNTKLKRIADALMHDPADRRTMAEWAAYVAMSERTLARLFVKETAMTFGKWKQQLHMLIAIERLASGQSVQHISDALGYESVSAFITMFKKVLGQSPKQFIRHQQ